MTHQTRVRRLTPDQWRHLESMLPSLVRMATALSGNQEDGEDLVQSAILQAMPVLSGISRPDRYLRRVIVNRWTDSVRRKRIVNEISTDAFDMPVVDFVADPAHQVISKDGVDRLLRCLDPADRILVVLRYVVGLNSREIAATVGGSAGAVRRRLHTSMALLRDTVKGDTQ